MTIFTTLQLLYIVNMILKTHNPHNIHYTFLMMILYLHAQNLFYNQWIEQILQQELTSSMSSYGRIICKTKSEDTSKLKFPRVQHCRILLLTSPQTIDKDHIYSIENNIATKNMYVYMMYLCMCLSNATTCTTTP